MMNNLEIAHELVKIAMMVISHKSSGLPEMGKYHNNPASIDAEIPEKYQKEFDSNNKDVIIKKGIPEKDYYDALKNLKSLFLTARPGPIEQGRSSSYNVQHFSTTSNINGTQYSIKIKVLIPTKEQMERSKKNPNPNNGEGKPKIKWIFMTKQGTRPPSRRFRKRS